MRSCRSCGKWAYLLMMITWWVGIWGAVFSVVAILLSAFPPFMLFSGLAIAAFIGLRYWQKRKMIDCWISDCTCVCHVMDECTCECHDEHEVVEEEPTEEEQAALNRPCKHCWATHEAFPDAKPGSISACECVCHKGGEATF